MTNDQTCEICDGTGTDYLGRPCRVHSPGPPGVRIAKPDDHEFVAQWGSFDCKACGVDIDDHPVPGLSDEGNALVRQMGAAEDRAAVDRFVLGIDPGDPTAVVGQAPSPDGLTVEAVYNTMLRIGRPDPARVIAVQFHDQYDADRTLSRIRRAAGGTVELLWGVPVCVVPTVPRGVMRMVRADDTHEDVQL